MRSPRCMSGPPPGHRGRNGAAIMTPYGGVPPRRSHCTRHIPAACGPGPGRVRGGLGPRCGRCRRLCGLCPHPFELPLRRQGANLGRISRAPRCASWSGLGFGCRRQGSCASSSRHARISHRHRPASPGGHFRSRLPSTTLLSGSRRASRNGTPAIGPDLDWSSKGRVSICEARAVRRERGGQQMGCHREQSRVMQSDAVLSTGSSSQQPRHLLG
jgi:hypothetical protein